MNTTPDEVLLALWLDDELQGEDLAKVESWALTQPDQIAAREEIRAWRKTIAAALPAVEEPPYPDFFNSRITKEIRAMQATPEPSAPAARPSLWRWLFPATAFAGMALAFWVGTKTHSTGSSTVADNGGAGSTPVWYIPEQGVDAQWVRGTGTSTVILLNGVNAIPDSMDFTETAMIQHAKESDSTAGAGSPGPTKISR
ncbi:MAG: hypothetical protein EOP87_03695 [Verrucomicrobiaceae bacterium]|nr:MAG: hypothetical protein EOP87_03695 [Verrucomicrobiaceae bacterium]